MDKKLLLWSRRPGLNAPRVLTDGSPRSSLLSNSASSPALRSSIARPASRPGSQSTKRPSSQPQARPGTSQSTQSLRLLSRSSSRPGAGSNPTSAKKGLWATAPAELQRGRGHAIREHSTRADRGVMISTQIENAKKEKVHQQLDHFNATALKRPDSSGSGDASETYATTESIKEVAAVFQEEVKDVDRQIEDLNRALRMDHLMNSEEDMENKRRAELEAARKQREAELRRARKREQMARDPHRKIQLKLENKRRFELDTLDQAGIPMRQMDFMSSRGREKVGVVDVRALVCKCQGLSEGIHSVHKLVENQERQERHKRIFGAFGSAKSKELYEMSLESGISTMSSSQKREYREEQARMKRALQHSETLMQKYNQMRDPPEFLPHSFDIFVDTGVSESGIAGMIKKRKNSLEEESIRHQSIHCKQRSRKSSVDGQRQSILEVDVSDATRQRAQRAMLAFRGVVRTLTVWFAHRRILNSVDLVKSFMWQLGEWSRIRTSVHKMLWSVRHLQKTCRSFLHLKQRRCELMHRDWQRVEDHFLSSFFKLYGAKAMEDKASEIEGELYVNAGTSGTKKVAKAQSFASKQKHEAQLSFYREKADELLRGLDWRAYRIPLRDRRKIIGRYYMIQLRKHVRSRDSLLKTVQMTVRYQRELVRFLKTLGAEEARQRQQLERPYLGSAALQLPEFWHLTEEITIELITMAAKLLVKMSPFHDHPANKAEVLLEHVYDKYCRPPRNLPEDVKISIVVEVGHRKTTRSEIARAERVGVTHQKIIPTQVPTQTERQVRFDEHRGPDVDEVFRGFTPRLQEIVAENREARLVEDKDGTELVNMIG